MKTRKLTLTTIALTLAFTLSTLAEIPAATATEWNVSLWGKRRAFTEHVEKLAELVSEKTNGKFTLNISYGGLSKNRENLDGISIGAFEMAQFCAGYHRDKNPSITVLELPFLGVSSLEQERRVSQELYQHPAVQSDLARWNATLLMPSPLPQYNIAGVGTAPETLGDFQGLNVRATGGIGKALETLGAVPTSMSATEVRQALDSGIVRAVAFAPHAHLSFGTVESAEWWTTNLNPGTVNCPVVVNTDALNALPADEREALLGSVDEALDHYLSLIHI
ncbi:MAG: TRAP transporter substrate-binding protein DctP, partial [Alphaproteobacteria bacterium]|nr:TRAP transporter substrate-binding protein DctP [Alphaproteobacteria bacterium]